MYLEQSDELNKVTSSGLTTLILAAEKGNKKIVELLLNAGTNVDACDYYGFTALVQAAIKGHRECADLIIRAGANVNKYSLNRYTPLMST